MTALRRRHQLAASIRGQHPSDGRKTERRQAERIPKHELPDWRVTLPLPGGLAFALSEGRSGVIGVAVTRDSRGALQLEATGKDCQWLFGQVATFIGKVKNGWQGRMHLRAQRDSYPGQTSGAPERPAVDRSQDVYLVMGPALVIPRGTREPLILKVE